MRQNLIVVHLNRTFPIRTCFFVNQFFPLLEKKTHLAQVCDASRSFDVANQIVLRCETQRTDMRTVNRLRERLSSGMSDAVCSKGGGETNGANIIKKYSGVSSWDRRCTARIRQKHK